MIHDLPGDASVGVCCLQEESSRGAVDTVIHQRFVFFNILCP